MLEWLGCGSRHIFGSSFSASRLGLLISAVSGCSFFVLDLDMGFGVSMLPTLSNGSLCLVDRLSPRLNALSNGDVVTCKSPTDSSSVWAKRLIGQAGDTVRRDPSRDSDLLTIAPGHIWLQGDNLRHSNDSRLCGSIPSTLLTGKILAIIYPFSRMSWLRSTLKYRGY